jgi:hypothetical protein
LLFSSTLLSHGYQNRIRGILTFGGKEVKKNIPFFGVKIFIFNRIILNGVKMANCPKCEMEISEDGYFCEECGYSIRKGQYNRTPPPPWVNQGIRSSRFKICAAILIIIILIFAGLVIIYLWSGGTIFYEYSPMNVKIITNSSWNGTISDWDGSREISGYGNETISVVGGDVKVTIQGSSSLKSLIVQIIRAHDGKILKEGSTTVPYGVVNVSYSH